MALPSSGTISMNDIRVELGVPSQAPFDLLAAVSGTYATLNIWSPSKPSTTAPYTLTSWYSYNHTAPSPNLASFYVEGIGAATTGDFTAYWTEDGGVAITSYKLEYKFGSGGSWVTFGTYGEGVYDVTSTVNGKVGFTSLSNTYFRLSATRSGIAVPGSPQNDAPPYPN